jgi:ribonucleoside-diphosphate reductase alpha chain
MSRKNYYWLTEESRKFLSRGYLNEGQKAEQRVRDMAITSERILGIPGHAKKLEEYAARGYYTFSTPVWCNFGNSKGLPISCYGSNVDDSLDSILNGAREVGMMSKYGGGTSGYFGNIRPRGSVITSGGNADGPVHYLQMYDTTIKICKQGESRRGAFAAYLPIEHPDIAEFLNIGTEGNPIQNIQHGVTVTDKFMEEMIAGDKDKRKIWAKVIQMRSEFGFPYIMFKDNSNNYSPYRDTHYEITHSNLCSEIQLPNNSDESFVCCLGSINLQRWDEIKNTDAVEVYVQFLNAVMEEFITKSKVLPGMSRAYNFAKKHRAIGLGVVGYHTYLQENRIPFESLEAKGKNYEMFSIISERADTESTRLCSEHGYISEVRPGYANSTLMAIAPTKSSSFILGQVSMGIEPIISNYHIKDLAKTKEIYKNPTMIALLTDLGKNTPEVWESILDKDGSVQHLDFLTALEKEVFKTILEISPAECVLQASQRQEFIDQSQSLNLAIHPDVPAKDINKLYITAWESGVKTLYYQYSQSAAQSFARDINTCNSCEG